MKVPKEMQTKNKENLTCPNCDSEDLNLINVKRCPEYLHFNVGDDNGRQIECRVFSNFGYFENKLKEIKYLDKIDVQGILKIDNEKKFIEVIDIKKLEP